MKENLITSGIFTKQTVLLQLYTPKIQLGGVESSIHCSPYQGGLPDGKEQGLPQKHDEIRYFQALEKGTLKEK